MTHSSWWRQLWEAAQRVKAPPPSLVDAAAAAHEEAYSPILAKDGGLCRRLGLFDLYLLGVGGSIGAGIFVLTGIAAQEAGPGVTVSFALAGLACVLNALCLAELSSCFPALVGGAYLYSYSAFNELIAFLVFSQIMVDSHFSAASIARSLASYVMDLLNFIPSLNGKLPKWLGPEGKELLGGFLSINLTAPLFLMVLTIILSRGVRESVTFNAIITMTKVIIVIVVIAVGSFEVDTSNWTPFAPNGLNAIVTGATLVFFSFLGYDAITFAAEESKKPKRDLPLGILACLFTCAVLYIGVSLVVTGMIPYYTISGDAPLVEAFSDKGLKYVAVLISVGATAGLSTTLLVNLYVQSRMYLGLGRDGLIPSFLAMVHHKNHTPIFAQIWCGLFASVLATFFNVSRLSHVLSVGSLFTSSVVCACVIMLRVKKEEHKGEKNHNFLTRWLEAYMCISGLGFCGLVIGLCFRFSSNFFYMIGILVIIILIAIPMYIHQEYKQPQGFNCPGIPTVPILGVLINMFLFAQLHWEAWVRFLVVGVASFIFYAFYGQHHAYHDIPSKEETTFYVAIEDRS